MTGLAAAVAATVDPFPLGPLLGLAAALYLDPAEIVEVRIFPSRVEVDVLTPDRDGDPQAAGPDVLVQTIRRRIDWTQP